MLYELDVLETRHIADLARDARKVRDQSLEKVPDAQLGEHNPSGNIVLNGVLVAEPKYAALREAFAALPARHPREATGWWRRSVAAMLQFLAGTRPSREHRR